MFYLIELNMIGVRNFLLLFLFFILLKSSAQKPDKEKSFVSFSISNMKWNTIEGTIKGMNGEVEFDPYDVENSRFDVCIDPRTINTGNDKRDDHLRNEDFFYVEKYPSICFTSKQVKKTEDGYSVIGELTLHGVTKTILIPFSAYKKENTLILKGSIQINRFDFNLAKESYSGTFMVGEKAEIEIVCVINQ